ncbi:hypothetical protein [Nitratidesulfovibrio sp. 1201_IL3209]|uniref:hypothetical protein n=1 Tax=Nitratidesulfovibrio sp. 1201_IL3209 TaxID=3084053 RepID=UPI002FDA386F
MAGQVGYVLTPRTNADGKVTGWRRDPFFSDKASILSAAVQSDAGPWLSHLAALLPTEVHKALASGGYLMQKLLRADIAAGGPPGTHWPELSDVQKSGKLDQARRGARRARKRSRFFGRLAQAIGYYRYPFPRMRVDIGWLSAAAQHYGYMLQRGTRTPVTRKMAGLFKGVFGWWPRKRSMDMPARPLMEPSLRAHAFELHAHMENRVARYLSASERWLQETRSNKSKYADSLRGPMGAGASAGTGARA